MILPGNRLKISIALANTHRYDVTQAAAEFVILIGLVLEYKGGLEALCADADQTTLHNGQEARYFDVEAHRHYDYPDVEYQCGD